jgi:hypothetical protein
LTTSFIAASCDAGIDASLFAVSSTVCSSRSNGTAMLISPASAASAPDSGWPVSACHFTRVRPSR